ncbi:MAG: glycosyltransferase family 2 protein [Kiritimatiellae bacterium]|nr:glycosyltransferase family 2 protein [Kiritimatiellia bacterium]
MTQIGDSSSGTAPPLQATLVICTYARGDILVKTLAQILPEVVRAGASLLVVDKQHPYPADVTEQLTQWEANGDLGRVVVTDAFLTGQRNIGLRKATGDVVIFIDDDVFLPPGFIEKHLHHYQDPSVAGVTGQVYHALDPEHPPELATPTQSSRPHFSAKALESTRSFIGCNHSVRRETALATGGYDEAYIGNAMTEDFDMADRLADAGHTLLYDPEAWLIHVRAPSGGCRGATQTTWPEWTRTASLFIYFFRHAGNRGNRALYLKNILRTGPLRKAVLQQPCAWPSAWAGMIRGAWYGWKHRIFQPAGAK